MNLLYLVFLESPLWLACFAFLLLAAALFARRRLHGAARNWALPGTIVLIILLFVLQFLVVTQREEVRDSLDHFIAAIERKDTPAIEAAISPDYLAEDMDRAGLLTYIESWLSRSKLYDTRLSSVEIAVQNGRAEASFIARATIAMDGSPGEFHWGRWKITLAKESGNWRVTAIQPVMLDGVQIGRLRDIRPP